MLYRPFGNTGIEVSVLGLGAMRLPMTPDGKRVDDEQAAAIINRALDLGINYIDTAPGYCQGDSERAVGQAIKGRRHQVYLSTKNPVEDASAATWRKYLEQSLRRLEVEYIDFYHMWGINWQRYQERIAVPGGPLDAARRAKEEGLIRHISFSFHDTPEALVRLIETGQFETMLVQYNLLDRRNEPGIALARERGMGVAIMGPVGGGRLSGRSEVLQQWMGGQLKSTPELALRFVLANPGVSVALSGMSTVKMVEENAVTASRPEPLSAEERAHIAAMLDETKRLADLYCTGCGYCLPCPNQVNIPVNFEYLIYYQVYGLREPARELYSKLGQPGHWVEGLPASACLECGECEEKCPQHIPIVAQLKEVARILGGQA